ncbi:BatD family protein [Vibrio litoralis]|uniref:BatD family protein n=1 Tax=Vibrio litoralis TaxID=335972 RepID=UPI0004037B78|nr:BatD family protein [Vibrio litoralis]
MLDSSTAIEATVGQPITRTLTPVVQDVSAESLPDIKIDYPNSVRVYSEKPKFGQDKSGNTVMILKQVIMPKKSGDIALPSVSVPWWNSKANQAETAKVNGITLKAKVDENAPQPSQALNVQPESTTNTTESHNTAEPKVVSTANNTNASFWPYTTALFAALWLITLVLLVQQKRKQPQTPTEEITPSKAQPNSFIDAVKSKDGAKIHSAFAQWQARHSNVAADLKHSIQSEINALMASLYSPQQQDYDTQTLLKLIKQAEKQSKKKPNNKQDEIAKL